MFRRKPKVLTPEQMEEIRTKAFFDMAATMSMKPKRPPSLIDTVYHSGRKNSIFV